MISESFAITPSQSVVGFERQTKGYRESFGVNRCDVVFGNEVYWYSLAVHDFSLQPARRAGIDHRVSKHKENVHRPNVKSIYPFSDSFPIPLNWGGDFQAG